MRTVSTGVGLCVLGVCVLGAAALSTSQVGGQAFAQSPSRAAVAQQDNEVTSPINAASGLTGCEDAPLEWLSQTPQLISYCGDALIGVLNIGVADLNGDGQAENFARPNAVHYPVYQGQIRSSDAAVVFRTQTQLLPDGERTVRLNRVLDTSQVGYWLRQRFPSCFQVELVVQGWVDVDGDGDLDLLGHISVVFPQNTATYQIWFENTGYESSSPPINPYDLDQDGEVGAGDISVLLLNFD